MDGLEQEAPAVASVPELRRHQLVGDRRAHRQQQRHGPAPETSGPQQAVGQEQRNQRHPEVLGEESERRQAGGSPEPALPRAVEAADPAEHRSAPEGEHRGVAHHVRAGDEEDRRDQARQGRDERIPTEPLGQSVGRERHAGGRQQEGEMQRYLPGSEQAHHRGDVVADQRGILRDLVHRQVGAVPIDREVEEVDRVALDVLGQP